MNDFATTLAEFVDGMHPLVQFLAVMGIGVVPFLESYVGAMVGTLVGIPVGLALAAAVIGNAAAVAVAVWAGSAIARKRESTRTSSERQRKVVARVDRYGVPVASLIAPTLLAISLTTFVMVAAGLNRRQVLIWQLITVVVWGAAFAAIGLGAVQLTSS